MWMKNKCNEENFKKNYMEWKLNALKIMNVMHVINVMKTE